MKKLTDHGQAQSVNSTILATAAAHRSPKRAHPSFNSPQIHHYRRTLQGEVLPLSPGKSKIRHRQSIRKCDYDGLTMAHFRFNTIQTPMPCVRPPQRNIELHRINPGASTYPVDFNALFPSHLILIATDSTMWHSPTPSQRRCAAGAAGSGTAARGTASITLWKQQFSVHTKLYEG